LPRFSLFYLVLDKGFILIFLLLFYIVSYPFVVELNVNRNLYNIFSWMLLAGLTYFLVGYVKNKSINKKLSIQYILIYLIIYILITYLLGLITGFYKVPFSFKLVDIFINVFNVALLILFKELTRYMFVFKWRYKKNWLFITTVIFSLVDIVMVIDMYEFNSALLVFTFIGEVLLTSIYNNFLQTILVYNVGFLPSFLYSVILNGYVYFVPIIPNLGIYLDSVLNIVLVVFLVLKLNVENFKYQNISKRKVNISKKYINIPIVLFLLIMIFLVSGVFRYKILAVVSNSMFPKIGLGDAVIYEKIDNYDELDVGDILVFTNEDVVYVHRIVEIARKNSDILVYTKGDNNQKNDNFVTYEDEILGVVRLRLKYIGYPSYWFNNMFG